MLSFDWMVKEADKVAAIIKLILLRFIFWCSSHKCLAATLHGPFFALQLPEAAIPEREATEDIGRRGVGMKMCEVCEAKRMHILKITLAMEL